MNVLRLTSPLPPSVNNYLNYKIGSRGSRKFVQAYPSKETETYKKFFLNYVKEEIQRQKWIKPPKNTLIFVKMIFYLDRKRKDPNNFMKVPLDVLTEADVYFDDDVVLPVAERVYIDAAWPRIEMEIFESEAIGIFNDKNDFNNFFKNNCEQCKKKSESCSILKKLLDNRIIKEVEDKVCLKKR